MAIIVNQKLFIFTIIIRDLASSARTSRSDPYVLHVLRTRALIAGSSDGRKIKIDEIRC